MKQPDTKIVLVRHKKTHFVCINRMPDGSFIGKGASRQTAINAAQRRLQRLINDLEKMR